MRIDMTVDDFLKSLHFDEFVGKVGRRMWLTTDEVDFSGLTFEIIC